MPKFKVEVTQVGRYERKIIMEVEAADADSAIEDVASGAVDVPAFDDPNWRTGYDLQNEEYELV